MKAVVITVGSELTAGLVKDANQAWISREIEGRGISTVLCLTVPDSRKGIAAALGCAWEVGPDMVVVTGGLGPTSDDQTAAAIAMAQGLDLIFNDRAAGMIRAALGADQLDSSQLKQAQLPAGSTPLEPSGTAPGFLLEGEPGLIVVLPGVPWEMRQMWARALESESVEALLSKARPGMRRTLCFYGSGEHRVDSAVGAAFDDMREDVSVSICARYREVMVDVFFPAGMEDRVEESLTKVKADLEDWFFSEGPGVESVVAGELTGRQKTLAVGESCTGGLLGAAVTSIPGSSSFFRGGAVAYHNDVKVSLMGVRTEILDNAGAVSEPVAQQLALGARSALEADYGIGITGVAGPTGGTAEKPVGLVFICASSELGDVVERFHFPGGREDVRAAAVKAALHMLHRKILSDYPS